MTHTHEDVEGHVTAFAGPSCPAALRRAFPSISWRGPAVAGDMLRLLQRPPSCAVLIDGLFDQSPAVRHKELLTLMSRGVHVVGSASMGALRAAELRAFGMIGVGQVYRAYAQGRLHGDDEVALQHGPADFDWAPLTVPLVNVRATLVAARRARVVAAGAARRMLRTASNIFYKDRTWDILASVWTDRGDLAPEPNAFLQWLPPGGVDVKRMDAAAGLRTALHLAHAVPLFTSPPPDTLFTQALGRSVVEAQRTSEQRRPNSVQKPGA